MEQVGIFPGNQGARFPRNLQTHTKFLQQFTLFWCEFEKFLVTGRNFLPQEAISCQRQKCPITINNFLALDIIYCHRKKLFFPNYPYFERSCRVWLPLFRAKFLAESIGSHEVKYFIPPCWDKIFYFVGANTFNQKFCPKQRESDATKGVQNSGNLGINLQIYIIFINASFDFFFLWQKFLSVTRNF